MFQPDETRKIDALLSKGTRKLELLYHPSEDNSQSRFSSNLEEIAKTITQRRSNISLLPGDGLGVPITPAFTLKGRGCGEIHYMALPIGLEFPPFLEALTGMTEDPPSRGNAIPALETVNRPATLLIFVASGCPHCPNAVREGIRLALAGDKVSVSIVDAQHHPKFAESLRVKAVPFSILDGELSWTGVKTADDIAMHIAARNDESYRLAVFQSCIESGRLDQAARELGKPHGVSSFLQTWKTSTTSSRLGLMLTAENVLETTPHQLDEGVMPLAGLLSVDDAALRGDTADLLGRIGHPHAIPFLEKLLDDPNPDVAEIAEEAIEEIEPNEHGAPHAK